MQTKKLIHSVSCHAEGEVGDVIVGGVAPPPGDTIWQQSRALAEDDQLRNFMLNEPRGGVFRHVNLIVPPKHEEAAAGWIIMEPMHNPPMSGSNSICVATVLLETGYVPMEEPITRFKLEAPGGLVDIEAHCEAGKVARIKTRNVPAFVSALDQRLEIEGLGSILVDIAYGGDSFVIVNASDVGLKVRADTAKDIAALGAKITRAANEQLSFQHPTQPDWDFISFCQIAEPVSRTPEGDLIAKNAVVIEPGKIDRSPCGTGCSARIAVLAARGDLKPGERYIGRSIIDSEFICAYEGETKVGALAAVITTISGRAWVTGTHQHMLDPDDPWPGGYRLSDTWPGA